MILKFNLFERKDVEKTEEIDILYNLLIFLCVRWNAHWIKEYYIFHTN